MSQILFISTIILCGFLTGQVMGRVVPKKIDLIRNIAVFVAMRISIPLSVLLAVWQLNTDNWSLAWLPLIGLVFLLAGFALGWLIAKLLRLPDMQKAVVAPAGSFTNIGAVGALVIFVLLGESGFALLPLFKLFEEVVYFGLLFPYAAKSSPLKHLAKRKWWHDPVLKTMLVSLALGLLLNIYGLVRPLWLENLTSVLVPIGSFSLMISIGLAFRFKSILHHWRVALVLAATRQVVLPLFVFCFVIVIGQAQLYNGLLLQFSVLMAAMPIGFLVILPASLYKLDQDLANACWLTSWLLFLAVLPFLAPLSAWLGNYG